MKPSRRVVLSKLTLGRQLFGIFAFVLVIASAQSFYGLYELRTINAKANSVQEQWLPAIQHASDMNTDLSNVRIAQLQHVLATAAGDKAGFDKDLGATLAKFDESRGAYAKVIRTDDQRALSEAFDGLWKQYMAFHPKLIELSQAGKTAEALALLNGDMQTPFEDASSTLTTLVEINKLGATLANDENNASYTSAVALIVGVGALMMAVSIFIAWRFIRAIQRKLGGELNAVVGVANSVGAGDLASAIQLRAGDTSSVMAAMQQMQQRLASVVADVRQSAEGVALASAEIAKGNSDLSGRTEQQASSLQQTASSMEQLGSTVRLNADNALQANELALGATTVATQGGAVVGRVVSTMKSIQDSSKRIADITGVIDGIAFQTNILALNAAVEAARAGEQGRGFAVVASEVRSLAQRSAAAAREIKTLIQDTVERIENGTAFADQAGTTMTDVVGSIQRLNDIMSKISAASAEQSAGVMQVDLAVKQMDQATQQNAALVEQSAAASESLEARARQLVDAVSLFKLSESNDTRPIAGATVPTAKPAARRAMRLPVAGRNEMATHGGADWATH